MAPLCFVVTGKGGGGMRGVFQFWFVNFATGFRLLRAFVAWTWPCNVYVNFFQIQKVLSADYFKLYTFEFNDFELTDDETILASIRMMLELDFMNVMHTKQRVSDYVNSDDFKG